MEHGVHTLTVGAVRLAVMALRLRLVRLALAVVTVAETAEAQAAVTQALVLVVLVGLVEILRSKAQPQETGQVVEEPVEVLRLSHFVLSTVEDAEPPQKLATTQSPQGHLYLVRVEAVAEGH